MAIPTPTTDLTRWTSAKYSHAVAQRAWNAIEHDEDCTARQQAALNLEDCRRVLFTTPAPDLGALIDKLTIWWGKALFNESELGATRRKLIGDLQRIQLEDAGIGEIEASGRLPEQAAADVEGWQAKLAEHCALEQLFAEGPSQRWKGRKKADIVTALTNVTVELLALPAPSLGGVTKKLELLWKDDRLEQVWNGAMYVLLMRDLYRLSRAH